jgi:hypothetical protein
MFLGSIIHLESSIGAFNWIQTITLIRTLVEAGVKLVEKGYVNGAVVLAPAKKTDGKTSDPKLAGPSHHDGFHEGSSKNHKH